MKLLKVINKIEKKDKPKLLGAFTIEELREKIKVAKVNDIIIFDEGEKWHNKI